MTFKDRQFKFHDFPGLENEILKFHDFPGFPWPVRTLNYRIYRHQQKVQNVPYELEVGHAVKLHLKVKGLKRRS